MESEKRSVVDEAAASENVAATAKRHGLQTQQIYRWREQLDRAAAPASFLPVTVSPDRPAAVLDVPGRYVTAEPKELDYPHALAQAQLTLPARQAARDARSGIPMLCVTALVSCSNRL